MGTSWKQKNGKSILSLLASELASDCEIIARCKRGNIVYLAIKRGDLVFGSVAKISQIGGEVGIDWIDEDMGPFYAEAPRSILEKLTPTDVKRSLEWRENCENWNKRKDFLDRDLRGEIIRFGGREYRIDSKVPRSSSYYVIDRKTFVQYKASKSQLMRASFKST
jgi:hypothetical protein